MTLGGFLLENASVFGLTASRIAGFVVVSPFPGRNVGVTQRVALVVVLSWIACAFAPATGAPLNLDLRLLGCAVMEVACGAIVGVAFRFVFASAEILGGVVAHASGVASASVLNPTLEVTETPFERILGLGGMLVALSVGAHRVALSGLLGSFRAIPVGSAVAMDLPLLPCVELASQAFVVGVRLATPVVAIALLVQVTLALISRAAPSLQIFSVGFAVLFVSTVAGLIACLDDVGSGLSAHFGILGSAIDAALTAMRP